MIHEGIWGQRSSSSLNRVSLSPPAVCPSGLTGRHIAQAQLMQSCLAAVKTSVLVIQRSQQTISAGLWAKRNCCELEDTLSSLLGRYVHILTDGTKQDKMFFETAWHTQPAAGCRSVDLPSFKCRNIQQQPTLVIIYYLLSQELLNSKNK